MKDENKATLIIADECHELDDAIVDHTTIRLRANEYQMLTKFGYGGFVKDMENYINSFKSVRIGEPFSVTREMMEGMAIMHDKVEELIDTFEDMMKDTNRRDHDQVGEALEQLQQIGDKTEIFDSVNGGEWMIDEYDTGYVSIKPVYAWQVSNYALFRKAQHFLHLSATICGVEEYAGSLGIVEGEYEFFDIPNPIPVANRKVYVLGQQRISGAFDIKKLANHVDKLIQLHAPANGIIHTVSYALANQIYLNSTKRKQMLVSKERHEIMNELKQHNSGRVILSASIEKGYDFKDDMSRFQIIAKVPFLYLGDPLVKLNVERRPRWYARKAILRIVQASGRSIRGVNDHAKTYILDSNFTRLLRENMDMFPDWYLESLVIPE
jgi:Rad3-related DNA helicase